MKQLLNTLYITTPNAWVKLEGQTLRVDVEREKKLQVPLHHLGSIVCFGDVMLTPAVLARCSEEGRSVVFLDRNGRFRARVEGPISGNILLRRAQFNLVGSEQALLFARDMIAGKLQNCRQVIMRGAREAASAEDETKLRECGQELAACITAIPNAAGLDQLRGIEGNAARAYFSVIPYLIREGAREAFAFSSRSRRPPLDRFNALLSFIYTLLVHDCRSALEGVGLDPQLGFLHTVRPGRPSLALDLMEELRPVLADRLALTLVNRAQLDQRDFEERTGGAVYLNEDGRKKVLVAYQERKQEELQHPFLETLMWSSKTVHVFKRPPIPRIGSVTGIPKWNAGAPDCST